MSFADIKSIISVISRYTDKYKSREDLPFLRYIINPSSELMCDDLEALHSCYEYYRSIFEKKTEKIKQNVSKKNQQIEAIKQIITEHIDINDRIIHELCCGLSLLGETLIKSTNSKLIGYDINKDLLEKNKIDFEKKKINSAEFKLCNLLEDKIKFDNTMNEVVTCLHGCGQLHRNIIDTLSEQKYNGSFFIIPCCYHRFTQQYTLYNVHFNLSCDQLEAVALNNNSYILSDEYKYVKYMMYNIQINIFVKYLIKNNLIKRKYKFMVYIQEYGYFTIKKIKVTGSKHEIWNKIFTDVFEDNLDRINYDDYKHIIDEQYVYCKEILDKILYEKNNILLHLTKLIEWLIIIDYCVHLQNMLPSHNITIEQFISNQNTPRNLMICGINKT
jgi:hypothetical protein